MAVLDRTGRSILSDGHPGTIWQGRPWPRYLHKTVCGHQTRTDVGPPAYPETDWCETCGHYVSVYYEERDAS